MLDENVLFFSWTMIAVYYSIKSND